MHPIISQLRKELHANLDQKSQESAQRFFKEKVKVYGIKTAQVVAISKKYFHKIKDLSKPEIFDMCEQLLTSGFLEESFVACNWSQKQAKKYQIQDWQTFAKWINQYVNNWATCDTFCNHTVGTFIEMYPNYLVNLKEMTNSSNRWVRRASAVSLIVPARKGKFLKEIFEIADALLMDKDDMVQKGYGWLLKVASEAHQQQVFQYVMTHKSTMPRTALRYAIEKMPKDLKIKAMEK